MSEEKYEGTVIWFGGRSSGKSDKDKKNYYGFISWEKDGVKQKDMFVHYSDIVCKGY